MHCAGLCGDHKDEQDEEDSLIREPSRELCSVGNPDGSPDITQAEEVSTHIKCTRSAEREWLNTKA